MLHGRATQRQASTDKKFAHAHRENQRQSLCKVVARRSSNLGMLISAYFTMNSGGQYQAAGRHALQVAQVIQAQRDGRRALALHREPIRRSAAAKRVQGGTLKQRELQGKGLIKPSKVSFLPR